MRWSVYPKVQYDALAREEKTKIQEMVENYIMSETSDPTKSPNSNLKDYLMYR